MRDRLAVALGRLARRLLLLRGGGSAVPGRIVLAIAPRFLERALGGLPLGVVFVSGSNGKSTTTNMLTGILRQHGLNVFTNPSGGNLPQGIASAMIADIPLDGIVRADVGVIEVDEAYGVELAARLRPSTTLLLNVQVDQLNRFFDPGRVAIMLGRVAAATTRNIIVNANDDSLMRLLADPALAGHDKTTFGAAPDVIEGSPHGLANVEDYERTASAVSPTPEVLVTRLHGRMAQMEIDGRPVEIPLPARGLHYAVDAAGAIAAARTVLRERFSPTETQEAFGSLRTVYGRGEVIQHRGEDIEIIMMKNPPSLQLNLDYLDDMPEQVLVAVDEGTPDPSWIYGIDLGRIKRVDVVTGTKAWQLATRLSYSSIPVDAVEPELKPALDRFLALDPPERGRKTMIVNYEQMMLIRKHLGYLDLEGTR